MSSGLDKWFNTPAQKAEKQSHDNESIEEKRDYPVKQERPEPDNLYILLSADYDSQEEKVYLKFYNIKTHKILIWYDTTGHKPYALSKAHPEELRMHPELAEMSDRIVDLIEVEKHDPITDTKVRMTKIIVRDPLAIGGTRTSLREKIKLWEADIKYHANYIFDLGFQVGAYYIIEDLDKLPKEVDMDIPSEIKSRIKDMEDESIYQWLKLLAMEVPNYKRVALDIEVFNPPGVMPRVEDPQYPIFIASLRGSDGLKKILVYDLRNEIKEDRLRLDDYEVEVYRSEKKLIERIIEIIKEYPIVVTFNGDKFDLPYIRKRGEAIGIPYIKEYIKLGRNDARITWGVHIDLYEFFKNVSIKTYAFSNAYDIVSLDSVAKALIGEGKIELDKSFEELTIYEAMDYAYRDADITYRLTEFNQNLLMNLMTMIARISNMTIDDVCRLSISNWIKNRLVFEHRKLNYLIPLREEIEAKGVKQHLKPVTKGKKYVGAIVIQPEPGIHFNVHVVDFASLYPSIIKEYNISYETVNCPHQECRDNLVEGTSTWICKKKIGIISKFAGAIRDVRVKVFKKLAKDKRISEDKRRFYDVVQSSLKVFINAIYGVMGSDAFPFYYLPAAEATTILGRNAIMKAIDISRKMGLKVIYGDTDSLFIKDPDLELLDKFISRVEKEIRLKLDIDKVYRYVVFSRRKKNYFGVLTDGTIDVKGLLGKKSSTPPFIKEIFYQVLSILKNVNTKDEFNKAKEDIKDIVLKAEARLRNGDVSIQDLAIAVTLSKPLHAYTKTTPQHVKAARKLRRALGIDISPGTIIKIIKTRDQDGASPLELVRSYKEVDVDKYIELLRSTLSQILEAMDIDIKEIQMKRQFRSLDQFFKL